MMNGSSENVAERKSILGVERGLYVLRYAAAAQVSAPIVEVQPCRGCERLVKLVFAPDADGRLAGPGSALVMVVEATATVEITARAASPGSSLEAKIELQALDKSKGAAAVDPSRPMVPTRAAPVPPATSSIEVVGHISRRGDVSATSGAWLAGPKDPGQIEGIALRLAAPTGISADYQVMVAGDSRWSNWISAGTFAGTRGQARPLTGVRVRLSGPIAADYTLHGAALFLGSPAVEQSGREIEFRSAAGVDPLIGFRIDLSVLPERLFEPVAANPVGSVARGRVRVFRAGQEASVAW